MQKGVVEAREASSWGGGGGGGGRAGMLHKDRNPTSHSNLKWPEPKTKTLTNPIFEMGDLRIAASANWGRGEKDRKKGPKQYADRSSACSEL